ncbi:hypothetical protein ATKI12_2910 [Kitasatospora sp. Ki12]
MGGVPPGRGEPYEGGVGGKSGAGPGPDRRRGRRTRKEGVTTKGS